MVVDEPRSRLPTWGFFERMMHSTRPMLCLLCLAPFATAAEPPKTTPIPFAPVDLKEPVVFDKHVFKILRDKCTSCHDREGGLAEGDLDLMTVEAVLKGGKRGAAAIPGKGAESLIVRLAAKQDKPFMPPKGDDPLTSEELSILKLWIDQGAKPGENPRPFEAMQKPPVKLGELPPGLHPVYCVDMNAERAMIAAGRANQVFVYDLASGDLKARLAGHKDIVQSVRFSPDGRWLAAGGYGEVLVWPVPSVQVSRTFAGHAAAVQALALDPSRRLAVTGAEDGGVRLWDVASGALLREIAGHPAAVDALAISPDGSILATGCRDKNLRLIRLVDASILLTLSGHGEAITGLEFSASGDWLASSSADGTARLWPAPTLLATPPGAIAPKPPAQTRILAGHGKGVSAVCFLGERVLTASEDGAARLWSLADANTIREVKHDSPLRAVAASPHAATFATGGDDGAVKIWRSTDAALVRTIPTDGKPVRGIAYSTDGSRLAVAGDDQSVRIWDPATGGLVHRALGHAGPIRAVRFLVGQDRFLTASADKSARSWETTDGWTEPVRLAPTTERATALAFSPDSKFLASGAGTPASSGEIVLWDLSKREVLRKIEEPHSDVVLGLAFSPDGKLLASASADKFLKVFDVAKGERAKSFEGHTGQVLCVAWDADGKQLATGAADGTVKLWNYETGEQVRTVDGHGKQVTGVAWVEGTKALVSSSSDKTARWITAADGKIQRGFGGAGDFLFCVAASPDGKQVAAGGQDGKVLLWNGADGTLLRSFDPPKAEALQAAR